MADRKDSFSLDGLFGGNFWDGVDMNVKQNVIDAVVGVLGKAGALTEAQADLLRAQRDKAVLDTENGKLRQAGVRPGQYLSQRQRREILNPEDAATRLQRLQFHGGMANGKWTNNYDEWKAASKNGHGTDSKGEEIKTKSFGFRIPTGRERTLERMEEKGWDKKRVGKALARWADKNGGDYRGMRIAGDGSVVLTFGDPSIAKYNRARAENARRKEIEENTSGEWMFDDKGRLKSNHAAVGGGQSGWLSMFGVRAPTNRYDWAIERERAWDRTMDRADRTIAGVIASARRPLVSDYDPVRDFSPRLSDSLMRSSWWDVNRTRQLSNPLYKDVPRAASKGGETMRERGWLDAVFARAERAAMRGGRTRR